MREVNKSRLGLTRPTRLSAEPTISKLLERRSCGLPGVDCTKRSLPKLRSSPTTATVEGGRTGGKKT